MARTVFERSVIFSRQFADMHNRLTNLLWQAVSFAGDTSIPSGENSRQQFTIPSDAGEVSVALLYKRLPDDLVRKLGWEDMDGYQRLTVGSSVLQMSSRR